MKEVLRKYGGWVLSALLAVSLVSCCQLERRVYDLADRSYYNAIVPEYRQYVERDPNLTETQRTRRLETIRQWDRDLKEREGVSLERTR